MSSSLLRWHHLKISLAANKLSMHLFIRTKLHFNIYQHFHMMAYRDKLFIFTLIPFPNI